MCENAEQIHLSISCSADSLAACTVLSKKFRLEPTRALFIVNSLGKLSVISKLVQYVSNYPEVTFARVARFSTILPAFLPSLVINPKFIEGVTPRFRCC